MKVLVTGAHGFIGRNLVARLQSEECPDVSEVLQFTLESDPEALVEYCSACDFVFHLAGVNRPLDDSDFGAGNVDLTRRVVGLLAQQPKPIVLTSSIQAALDNAYGVSKKAAEDAVFAYAEETGADVCVYRLPGVFGKWSQPNYNSVVATFCHNAARGIALRVDDPTSELVLAYIDDVVDEFLRAMRGEVAGQTSPLSVPLTHQTSVGELAHAILGFAGTRETLAVPTLDDAFIRKLYATYLSYLPPDELAYPLTTHADDRGSFTEILRTHDRGQFSVNVIRPGIVKGDHWHETKHEKFLVVSGSARVRLREVDRAEVVEYLLTANELRVLDIPPGYTHNIQNTGDTDAVVFMWASEPFSERRPDTHPSLVEVRDR